MNEIYAVLIKQQLPYYSEVAEKFFTKQQDAVMYAEYLSQTMKKSNKSIKIAVEPFTLFDSIESAAVAMQPLA